MYPTKDQIKNRLRSIEVILSSLYQEQKKLEYAIKSVEDEQKALYLLDDLVKETQQ